MENSIWVGKSRDSGVYIFTEERPTSVSGGLHDKWYGGYWIIEFLNLDLKPLEIVELIYDTETGNVEIKREREIGWYLTANGGGHKGATTYHWNGNDWCRNRKGGCFTHEDGTVTVVSEKLPYNEYLKGLE